MLTNNQHFHRCVAHTGIVCIFKHFILLLMVLGWFIIISPCHAWGQRQYENLQNQIAIPCIPLRCIFISINCSNMNMTRVQSNIVYTHIRLIIQCDKLYRTHYLILLADENKDIRNIKFKMKRKKSDNKRKWKRRRRNKKDKMKVK